MKKKLVVYYAGEWAERLLTVSRCKDISYFVDEERTDVFSGGVPVCLPEHLWKENREDVLILVSDSHRYGEAKEALEAHGFKENVHFFNGWKLDFEFYRQMVGASQWESFEKSHQGCLERQRKPWSIRAKMIAELLPADVHSVMDLGCGEGLIRQYLPEGIQYYGVDYCKRADDTIVCDLNHEPIPDIQVDAYLMIGLIKYIEDKKRFLKQLRKAKYVLASYFIYEMNLRLDGRINLYYDDIGTEAFSTADFINLMVENGFYVQHLSWPWKELDEFHYLFVRK